MSASGKGKKNKKTAALWQNGLPQGYKSVFLPVLLAGIIAAILFALLENSALFAQKTSSCPVVVSEYMSDNASSLYAPSGDASDWIELENTGSERVDLKGCALYLASDPASVYVFPSLKLEAGEQKVVFADGGAEGAPFKLPASGGDTLIFLDGKGAVADSVPLLEMPVDISAVRMPDGTWELTNTPTPGGGNRVSSTAASAEASVEVIPGDAVISEVMSTNTLYNRDAYGETNDYVEIRNVSGHPLNIGGWYLSDSAAKLKRWSFPSATIPADGYLTVYCSGRNETDANGNIHTNFGISRSGETLYLTTDAGQTVSSVTVPALARNQAYSFTQDGWTTALAPTPGAPNSYENGAAITAVRNSANTTGVIINEIMASAVNEGGDWIEIYNGSAQTVDISSWGLSNDAAKPRKYQFPAGTTIGPGEYMTVVCTALPNERIAGCLNTAFALSKNGGYTVSLSEPDGKVLDSVYLPEQFAGISYGRVNGSDQFMYFTSGTPLAPNNTASCYGMAPRAICSVPGGVYKTGDSFAVELSAPSGARIYYTTDCSDPDEHSQFYTSPIEISDTSILRTRVYMDGYLPSYMDTQSYLYNVNNDGQVYIVSLVSDPENLFSDEKGIMVKGPNATDKYPFGSMNRGANFWMDWERESHVEIFEADGSPALSSECGVKLHGQYSRAADIKGFKVIARAEYGNNRFRYPIFSNRDYPEYQSFLLRASGQDYNMTFMRDSVLTTLAKDTSVCYQESEVGVLFINGQYYSLMNLRERINTTMICQFEGWEGMEDDIDLIKANSREMQGSNASMEELLKWIKGHDTTTPEAYEQICRYIDIDNYIEYMAIEIFAGNGDTLNVKRYRNPLTDGKWRWVLFDLDWAFFVDTNSIARWLDPTGMGTGKYTDTTLFIGLMKNPVFRDKFLTYFGQQLATTFSSANTVALFKERYELIDGLLPDYYARAGLTQASYNKQLKKLITYAETRPTKIIGYFKDALKLSDADTEKYFGEAIAVIQSYQRTT